MNLSRKKDEFGKKAHAVRMPAKFADMTEEEMERDGGFGWVAINRILGFTSLSVYGFSVGAMIFDKEHRDAWAITAVAAGYAAGGFFWNASRIYRNTPTNAVASPRTTQQTELPDMMNEWDYDPYSACK